MEQKQPADLRDLCNALLLLKTPQECQALLEDLCTIRELQDISQRLAVAKMLDSGRNYAEIASETGASSATISRVNRCLQYGSRGYRLVLDRMQEANK